MHKLIRISNELALDLAGKVVITEAASGPYAATAVYAALAGADVHAFVKDSRFGSVSEVKEQVISLAAQLNCQNRISFYESRHDLPWSKADIITNSGSLRPIADEFIVQCPNSCVLSLMFEEWEYREQDFSLTTCKQNNIRVVGVNERHPQVDVFGYLGDMVIRLIQDAGKTPYRNSFIVVGNNDFVPYLLQPLTAAAARVGVFAPSNYKLKIEQLGAQYLGEFASFQILPEWESTEAVIYTGAPFTHVRWHESDSLRASELSKLNAPVLLRFAGDIDEKHLATNNVTFYPSAVASGHMGIIPSQIGWDPILRLQAGGLKVAELAHKNETQYKGIELVQYL